MMAASMLSTLRACEVISREVGEHGELGSGWMVGF